MAQYIITDGERFIYKNRSGKYLPTYSEAMADIFDKRQAEGIFNNSLSKALKTVFYVKKYDVPEKCVKQLNKEELKKNTAKAEFSSNIQKWVEKIETLNGLAKDARKRKVELIEEQNRVEMELQDIIHWIEFSRFNAAEGYKACKEMKDCRMKRRAIKDELRVLDVILEQKITETIGEEIENSVSKLDKRTYEPRIRKDLFDL